MMKRLAHRGYSDLFPENTMSAFEKAVNSSFVDGKSNPIETKYLLSSLLISN